MKLLLGCILLLTACALFTQLGMADYLFDPDLAMMGDTWTASANGTFDVDGHQLLDAQGFREGEYGQVFIEGKQMYWLNETNAGSIIGIQGVDPFSRDKSYPCWQLAEGESINAYNAGDLNISITNDTYMILAVIVGLIVLAGVAGFKVLSSGESDVSVKVIVLGTGLLTLWGILSLAAYSLIVSIPIFGIIFYFGLTIAYTIGCIQQFGGSDA